MTSAVVSVALVVQEWVTEGWTIVPEVVELQFHVDLRSDGARLGLAIRRLWRLCSY